MSGMANARETSYLECSSTMKSNFDGMQKLGHVATF